MVISRMASRPVSGVVLAAGPSRRFGDRPPKQLLAFDGEPLVRRVVGRALRSRLFEVIVVVGKAASEVERSCQGLDVQIVVNPDFESGQSLSVKLGLAAVDPAADAVMFIPVDQPGLTTEVLDAIFDRYCQTGGPIVIPCHRGRRGAPVIFDRTLFSELGEIEGDAGGRQLFSSHEGDIVELQMASDGPLRDLDTFEDLQGLRS